MKDHTGCEPGYYWTAKAWYAKANNCYDEITFGMYDLIGGGTSGEMIMQWKELGGETVPQLKVFTDAWSALALFGDVIAELAKHDNENITQEQFIDILKDCGFKDLTPYTQK